MRDFTVVRRSLGLLLFTLVAPGCGAMVTPGGDASVDVAADSSPSSDVLPSNTCRITADCRSDQLCDGPPGCGVPWTCVPFPACETLAASFCACDGVTTFIASPGCVGRPYLHQGECETPAMDGGVVDAGGRCSVQVADEVRVANAVYCDQSLDLTLHLDNAGGCGCTVTPSDSPSGITNNVSVCDCCDLCDCIDGVAETSVVRPAMPCTSQPTEVHIAGRTVWVVSRPATAPATLVPTITSARVLPPRSTSGPRLWWLHVQGSIPRCASSGTLTCISQQVMPNGLEQRIEVYPNDCSQFDCDGPMHPEPIDTWHSLGELASGTYTIVVPGVPDQRIVVP